jgi:fatty acid desaturase
MKERKKQLPARRRGVRSPAGAVFFFGEEGRQSAAERSAGDSGRSGKEKIAAAARTVAAGAPQPAVGARQRVYFGDEDARTRGVLGAQPGQRLVVADERAARRLGANDVLLQ